MAKVPFSKLDSKINSDIENISFLNSKGEEVSIEVKYYLPVEEKMEMISKIINQSIDDNGFYNPMRVEIFKVLEMVQAYTNLSFTAKQKDNPFKLYDQLISSGLFFEIKETILPEELKEIEKTIIDTIDNIYKYKNSIMGIIDSISTDYSAVDMDLNAIQEKLADPNALNLIKEVLPLMNA